MRTVSIAILTTSVMAVHLPVIGCRTPAILVRDTDPESSDSAHPEDSDPSQDSDPPQDTAIEQIPDGPEVWAGAELFDEATIPEFALELSAESMIALRSSPTEYAPATFTYQDQVFEDVGVRTKGSSTWQAIDEKPSLKIKFDKYVEDQRFMDLSEITINNMVSDYSMMHERVAYRFYREAGVPARRAHHAHLTLNGEDYGLYVHVESATRKLIEPWFDDSGTLWEFWGADFEAAYVSEFELKFGDDDKKVLHETAAMLTGDGAFDVDAIEATLDLDAYLRYWAVCAIVGQYDGYPYRYPSDDAYVYHDPTSGQLKFMPHGVDESFYYPDWRPDDDVISRLGWKCLATPECEARWIELIFESLDTIEALDPLPWVDEVQAQIEPYVLSDPKKPYNDGAVMTYQASMRDMIANRRTQLERLTAR